MRQKWIFTQLAISFATFVSTATFAQGKYTLNGIIDELFNEQEVMLFQFKNDSIIRVDTTRVNNGTFSFQGPTYIEDFSVLTAGNYPEKVKSMEVILEEALIEVDLEQRLVKQGGDLHKLYQSYKDTMKMHSDIILPLYEEAGGIIKRDSALYRQYQKAGRFSATFKRNNIHNLVGKKLFKEEAGRMTTENIAFKGHDKAFEYILSAADDDLKNQKWVKKFLQQQKEFHEKQQAQRNSVGRYFSDFNLLDESGDSLKFSSLTGKSYILLDFWASWCAPCIAEFPNLKEVYQKYHEDGLEIIGVSIDSSPQAWTQALKKVNTPWPNYLISPKNKEKIQTLYNFAGIPYSLLIAPNGIIKAVNLRGKFVEETIQREMAKDKK